MLCSGCQHTFRKHHHISLYTKFTALLEKNSHVIPSPQAMSSVVQKVANQVIKVLELSQTRKVNITWLEEYKNWHRVGETLSAETKNEFASLVERDSELIKENTVTVAMRLVLAFFYIIIDMRDLTYVTSRETPHKSKDKKTHYTAVQLDKDGEEVTVDHLYP
jgi:hypothetical protein